MASDSNHPTQGEGNYSVDEMMAHLKRGERQRRRTDPSEEGELVTREDGTQAVKVRRRKRRSKQPEKKKKTLNPKVKWAILGSIVGFGLLLIVGTVIIIAKYNGRKFKATTEATISELSGAGETELTQLRVTPVSAKAAKVDLAWDRHSFLKSASFSNLRSDLKATSFFTSDWIGETVVASVGKAYLQAPVTQAESGSGPLESPYKFDSYRCNQLDLHFGDDREAPSILGLQISLRKMVSERYQYVFQDGTVKIKNWPDLKLASGVITLNSQDAEVIALLDSENNHSGELSISGRISKDTSKTISLDIKAKDYPIQELLGKELGRLVRGTIQSDLGSLSYDYAKTADQGLSFDMPFTSLNIDLSELPMLTTMKDLTGNTDYLRPSFNHCRGNISRTSDGVSLNKLVWISNSLITLQGNINVDSEKKMSGTLDVGIPTSAFDGTPPAPFQGPKDGLYHAKVTLGGTIHNPHDNLRELLKVNTAEKSEPKLPEGIPASPADRKAEQEKEFDDLSR
ncbi:hypothetical protein NT6N_12170 [Oceaniferula spumae]|uniref:AsmA-like C-terminal domain-containing protein n=1 Tax=Oceaniferula spumae TaxID=2979115 RepID=A0AAT9FJQ7_9BACT